MSICGEYILKKKCSVLKYYDTNKEKK